MHVETLALTRAHHKSSSEAKNEGQKTLFFSFPFFLSSFQKSKAYFSASTLPPK